MEKVTCDLFGEKIVKIGNMPKTIKRFSKHNLISSAEGIPFKGRGPNRRNSFLGGIWLFQQSCKRSCEKGLKSYCKRPVVYMVKNHIMREANLKTPKNFKQKICKNFRTMRSGENTPWVSEQWLCSGERPIFGVPALPHCPLLIPPRVSNPRPSQVNKKLSRIFSFINFFALHFKEKMHFFLFIISTKVFKVFNFHLC